MVDLTISKIPQVSTKEWLDPVQAETLHTIVQTKIGNFTLYRKPARRNTVEAKAENWEEWNFTFGDQVVMTIEDAAAPWISLHKRMRAGIHGKLDGMAFRAHAKRSIAPSKRTVRFTFEDHSLRFGVEGLSKVLYRESLGGRHLIAKSRRGKWHGSELTMRTGAVICFFTTAGLDIFLESPLWDIPPF